MSHRFYQLPCRLAVVAVVFMVYMVVAIPLDVLVPLGMICLFLLTSLCAEFDPFLCVSLGFF